LKFKEFADNRFKDYGIERYSAGRVEIIVGKEEIAQNEQFLLFIH